LRARLDPFALAATIDRKLHQIYRLTTRRCRPRAVLPAAAGLSLASSHGPATGTTTGSFPRGRPSRVPLGPR